MSAFRFPRLTLLAAMLVAFAAALPAQKLGPPKLDHVFDLHLQFGDALLYRRFDAIKACVVPFC